MKTATIRLHQINKKYGENHIVKDLDLHVYEGEFLTLLGPSGCGKTTTLRMIAGFEYPTSGEILLHNQPVTDLPPNKRDVNTVFQNYALFPHMTVRENVGYGLKMRKTRQADIDQRVTEALRMAQLESFANRKPRQMSGGQQQRVAIARAIVNNPKVLLLDEPLGALDLKLRKQMQFELKHLQQKLGITFIYVTHDQEEALTMSDRVAVMNNGRIEQIDVPNKIYNQPKTRFVADFIGETNLLQGRVVRKNHEKVEVMMEGVICALRGHGKATTQEDVYVSIRPEMLSLSQHRPDGTFLIGRVEEHVFVGSAFKTIVRLSSGREMVIVQSASSHEPIQQGEEVYISWDLNKSVVLVS
ncbi:ABC transporter ATP-binding protein [Brevibacillus sp. NRS-1366]|uniref:ABC transporter ATP-binding protein n=1 Tax=Brevibacillus sp. NRS-1366 TaxID=3233899 RepID=UPI003D1BEC9A